MSMARRKPQRRQRAKNPPNKRSEVIRAKINNHATPTAECSTTSILQSSEHKSISPNSISTEKPSFIGGIVGIVLIILVVWPFSYAYYISLTPFHDQTDLPPHMGMIASVLTYIILRFIIRANIPLIAIITSSITLGVCIHILMIAYYTSTAPDFFTNVIIMSITFAAFQFTALVNSEVADKNLPLLDAVKRSIRDALIGAFLSVPGYFSLATNIYLTYGDITYTHSFKYYYMLALSISLCYLLINLPIVYSVSYIKQGMSTLKGITPYLRILSMPFIGFVSIYFSIIFIFAIYYWAVYLYSLNGCISPFRQPSPDVLLAVYKVGIDGCSSPFKGLSPNPPFWDFLYYSVVTMVTLGYGDITATAPLTKIFSSIEVILGIGWTIVGFAAVVAYVQPRFLELTERLPKN